MRAGLRRRTKSAILAASRYGDFDALLAVLDPDVVLRADPATVRAAAASRADGATVLASEIRGAAAAVDTFAGRAQTAQPALIDAAVGAVWAPECTPRVVFDFTISAGRVVAIDLLSDPELVRGLDIIIVADAPEAAESRDAASGRGVTPPAAHPGARAAPRGTRRPGRTGARRRSGPALSVG